MSFSIRLSAEEKSLAESYAKIHGFSLGEAFKKALFEKIEDEYDIAVGDLAYEEFLKDPQTISHDDLKKELGLWVTK